MKARRGAIAVLIVDDDVSLRRLERMLLEREGYKILEAENGTAALNVLQSEPVDMVVLDVIMPDISGLDLLAEMRSIPMTAKVPVLLCTSVSDRSQVTRALEYGINGYFLKPIVAKDFIKKVASLEDSVVPILELPRETQFKLGISQEEFRELVTIMLDESQKRLREIGRNLETGEFEPFIAFARDLSASAEHFGARALQMTADNIVARINEMNTGNLEHFVLSLRTQMARLRQRIIETTTK